MSEIAPGIYPDIPDAEYRAWPYPSQSVLSMFRDDDLCEREIRHRLEHPPEPTEAMRLGLLVESAIRGEALLPTNARLLPETVKVRRGKAWEALQAEDETVDWKTPSQWAAMHESVKLAQAMAQSVRDDGLAAKLLNGAKSQVSFVWDATFAGMSGADVTYRLKGRLDWWNEALGAIADLKTTMAGGPRSIGAAAWRMGYDVQAALYTDAMRGLTARADLRFYFVFVRTVEPHVVSVYNGLNSHEAADGYLSIGRRAYQTYLEQLAECRLTGNWRGYYTPDAPDSRVLDMYLPAWAM